MDAFKQPKPRVNGSMLPKHQGSIVCLLGLLKNVDPNGTSLTLTLSDGVDAQVNLQTPLDRPIEGLVEVVGQVGANPRQIKGLNLISHGQKDFDMELYDEVLKITHEFPQYYRLGASEN
ncbi:replication protein A 14 kDa subunit [Strongylocentrotus purpuratus]|uniref:Replication factor A protein 3 n=1 Tax=Strongylocentrotus purpuratus TaxID=7668 RepID=A0A7M7T174_STRPU|nr:replication protein A 14 kDa subunit [Strongylocentrotus purpuratus]|eukprot:XP_781680.2 PREDICTED: replication protein A 14 kDa subunit [Strongylocentrotus purpuratus]